MSRKPFHRQYRIAQSASAKPHTIALLLAGLVAGFAALPAWGGQVCWRGSGERVGYAISAESGGSGEEKSAEAAAELLVGPDSEESRRHVVVQFDRGLTAADRAAVSLAGLQLLSPLGDNSFFAVVEPGRVDLAALTRAVPLRHAQAVQRAWKLHPGFTGKELPRRAIVTTAESDREDTPPTVAAYLLFHQDIPLIPDGENIAKRHGATVRSYLRAVNGLVIELPADRITPLADEDAVQWIEPPLPAFGEANDSNRWLTQAETVQTHPDYELDGTGVTVLLYDGGVADGTHPDFGGRLTARDGSDEDSHPTHVAGTIGGSGLASNGVYRGMAPGVIIESYGFETQYHEENPPLYADPGDLENDYSDAIANFGVDVANNSIGTNTCTNGFDCAITGDYGITAQLIDAIVTGTLGNPLTVVWSNGNERNCSRCRTEGVHTPEGYHSTAPPSCAKNHITVGAVNANDDFTTIFSSWGPTDDGRIKPDVTAPGCEIGDDFGVTSCVIGGGYMSACGTSMSAPTVTGLIALLLEDYRTLLPAAADPRNATIKAILTHNAADLGNRGPDYQNGYGSVRIRDSIDFLRTEQFREGQLDQGERYPLLVQVDPGDGELKITLAWDDYPAAPNVTRALVNDLDLRVFDPQGNRHYPWTLDPADPAAPATRVRADHLNNIEQVLVDDPAAGLWLVEVFGYGVPAGPQSFSLCVSPQIPTDCDGNGQADDAEITANPDLDCSGNGLLDVCEIDCDGNGIPDSCDIEAGLADDCNGNDLVDACEPDCNGNGIPDDCDVIDLLVADCNHNGVPDDCEPDCNSNNVADSCDIESGTVADCNADGVPDICQDTSADCNDNGEWDACETAEGLTEDFNHNSVPDVCEDRERILYVDANCSGPGTGTIEDPFCAIQPAINAAISGNRVIVAEGVYQGRHNRDLDFGGRLITLQSTDPANAAVVAGTVIDPQGAGRGFFFHSHETRSAVLDGLTIRNGTAAVGSTFGSYRGGAIYCVDSNPTIRRCVLQDNSIAPTILVEYGGGGIYCERSSPAIDRCTITGNETTNSGGGVYCFENSPAAITDSVISGNQSFLGGGIACYLSNALIRNCTIVDNLADGYRGGALHCNDAIPTVTSSILWGNLGETGPDQIFGEPTVSYSDVEGGWVGTGNLDADPAFIAGGDYHLTDNSPCIDAGDPAFFSATATDLDGEPRVFLGRVDIGADEYIDTDCNNNGIDDSADLAGGTSEDCNGNGIPDECEPDCNHNGVADECDIAWGYSQDRNGNRIPDECEPGRVFYVDDDGPGDAGPGDPALSDPLEDGTLEHPYDAIQEAIDVSRSGDLIIIADGIYRRSGNRDLDFHGRAITVRGESHPGESIIDGEHVSRGFIFHTGESRSARLEGVTIRNCRADLGAGVYCTNSSPTIFNCRIVDCTAENSGGGLYCRSGQPTITHCLLRNNTAGGSTGGAIYALESRPILQYCSISGNTAGYGGGGVGAMNGSDVILTNCLISDNTARNGGAVYWYRSNLNAQRCTIAGNRATGGSGHALYATSADANLRNTIVWQGGSLNYVGQVYADTRSELDFAYSDVQGGTDGFVGGGLTAWSGENLAVDPLFRDPAHSDYHLLPRSPAIDAGDPHFGPAGFREVDLDGNERLIGRLDLGAFEFSPDCNGNGKPDDQDIGEHRSADCNGNALPDECEADCNENGIADDCDIAGGTSDDCNDNGVADECDLAYGESEDLNANQVLDECELCDADADCDDGLFCNGAEFCANGWCQTGADPCPGQYCREDTNDCADCLGDSDCDDLNACTIEECVAGSCRYTVTTGPCDDGDRCTVNDTCVGDTCVGTPVPNCGVYFALRAGEINGLPIAGGPAGSATIAPGDRVTCEIFVVNWFPQNLQLYQATIDASGYVSGRSGRLSPLIDPAPSAGAFIDHARADFTFAGIDIISAVDSTQPNYRYGALGLVDSVPDQGMPGYCGTLILDVSADATGRFEVGFITHPLYTYLSDKTSTELQPLGLEPLTLFVDTDCNGNGVPDDLDIAGGTSSDCGGEGLPDECEPDCNANGRGDSCDVLDLSSADCNNNGTPDECEPDCNSNGTPDDCDVTNETSADCNDNDSPDECDVLGVSKDCNQNGTPDECEPDCNSNDFADDCDIDLGLSADADDNGVPDECEPDCNANGMPDAWDITTGVSADAEPNGIPDECQRVLHVPGEYRHIQHAIDLAQPGDVILLAEGLYRGEGNTWVEFNGKVVTLRCAGPPATCVVDGDGVEQGFRFLNGESAKTRVEGLTITNCSVGVLSSHGSSPLIEGCRIVGNIGSGVYTLYGSRPLFRRCAIAGNYSQGVYCWEGHPIVESCLIVDNRGYGTYAREGSSPILAHSTISGNGNALRFVGGAPIVHDSIIWGNGSAASPRVAVSEEAVLTLQYCDIEGGQAAVYADAGSAIVWGAGNIDANPRFLDADGPDDDNLAWEDNDHHLSPTSICINSGDPAYVPDTGEADIDSDPRVLFGVADIGADEANAFADCDNNGVPDSHEIAAGIATDCNDNGVPDACDIADTPAPGGSADCNNNDLPDECDIAVPFETSSPLLSPIGTGFPQSFTILAAPAAVSDVIMTLQVRADLNGTGEEIAVRLSGTPVGTLFGDGANACPTGADVATLIVPYSVYNAAIDDGSVTVELIASETVNAFRCRTGSFISVALAYSAVGTSADNNRNGVPDECETPAGSIIDSDPPTGAIDARQPLAFDRAADLWGFSSIDLTFDGDVSNLTAADFCVTQDGGDGNPPGISSVETLAPDSIRLHLSKPIEPEAWTVIAHLDSSSRVCLGCLPGDVSGDRISEATDITALVQSLNNGAGEALPLHSTDINRSSTTTAGDILALIDLLNGAGEYSPWLTRTLPPDPCTTPAG